MKMKLIADCGSTKIDWALCDDVRGIETFNSPGVNPVFMEPEEIYESFSKAFDTYLLGNKQVTEAFFYGAGCIGKNIEKVTQVLRKFFPSAMVMVSSDLLGAARALFHHEEGIACILGTGSNSCLFDGENIVKNVPPLGFVLGDEGSGAVLGKQLINKIYKGQASDELRLAFEKETGLTLPEIISNVYHGAMPSRFLASLVSFASRHIDDATIERIVVDNFASFITNNVAAYGRKDLPVSFVGGMSLSFEKQLRQVVSDAGYIMGTILAKPIGGLIDFHTACS